MFAAALAGVALSLVVPDNRIASVAFALAFAAFVFALMSIPLGARSLAWAAPLGRMAFTNYLAQSVIFALIFFGYGLGMFNRLGIAATLAIGVAVYALQVVVSAWWLRHHRFGPMEWLWRSAMYGTPQPWRA